MADNLYTRVTPSFDVSDLVGKKVLVAAAEARSTLGFTELGWDAYTGPEVVYEIVPRASNYATAEDVLQAAEETYFDFDEDEAPNILLLNPEVRQRLEQKGFDAFRDFVVVENGQPELYCFWSPKTFEIVGPANIASEDADQNRSTGGADVFWLAEFESPNTRSRGAGKTPEEAVSALLLTWHRWAEMSDADPDYMKEYREDIEINLVATGSGYLLGDTDALWHQDGLRGDDPRFDEIFEPSPKPGM